MCPFWICVSSGAHTAQTCKTLKLNLDDGLAGRTWLLLPEGYRDQEQGKTYPLPGTRNELQKLAMIPIPLGKMDSGCIYLRRAAEAYRSKVTAMQSAALDIGRKASQTLDMKHNFGTDLRRMKEEAAKAVEGVKIEAGKAIASLSDLFRLGREGLEGQMKAHLAGETWKGEQIDAEAFRNCFRMVSQTVKGMGLPSDQTEKAKEAIIEEAAAALRDTREALAMAPGTDAETKH